MAAHGPGEGFEEEGQVIKDRNGTEFTLGKELGHGVVGKTYRGTVSKVGKGDFKLGQEVAIKSQPLSTDPDEIAAQQRELAAAKKEGILLATPNETAERSYMVQPIFPGVDLRSAIYQLTGEKGFETVAGKAKLPDPEKEMIAIGILREYDVMQKLNIVHADVKPDNFLYDKASGTVKLLDLGQAFDGTQGSPHDLFAAPGVIYTPPERHNNRELANSSKTDLYNIGIIIASLYSENCFERDADTGEIGENSAVKVREALKDVLDSTKPVAGMPPELLKMVQHLTAVDPASRAQNIALAHGATDYHAMTSITQSQQRAMLQINDIKSIADSYIKNANEPLKSQVRAAVNQLDLTTIANDLSKIARENSADKKLKTMVSDAVKRIDKFNTQEAKAIQSTRIEAAEKSKQAQSYSQSLKNIATTLNDVANQHKKPSTDGTLLMSATFASQYDEVGKVFNYMAKTVAAQTTPEGVDRTLQMLSEQVKKMPAETFGQGGENKRQQLLSIVDNASKMHAQIRQEQKPAATPAKLR
ncbi:protein kinase domain-containing protein [Candidatus Berkiella aquae]|uniref:Protein kinase n=1 Tax=Candidatus Berkiella aquae TaxID=295108 RepID=A0A0Q9YDP8_9GAMM|nr:protein kinase [Candidatus Berkiella aquae]MCS5709929.1 protein kinase [Candidatus Berkiella aquae]